MPGPITSSSTSATATCWRSSTSPASTSAPTPRSSAACTIWRSRYRRRSGPRCAPTWTRPASATSKRAACRCTSATPTAPASSSSPSLSARCMASTSSSHTSPRAQGALYGLAIGDALGMPTQMLSRAEIIRRWGGLLRGFEPAPPGHPIAAGMPAGAVTDDTEQAVLLGRLLVRGDGAVDPRELAQALVSWERDMAERGSLDLLGPSTKRAVAAVLAGTPPQDAGASGDTNGAAMRIAPVGIAVPLAPDLAVPLAPDHNDLSTLVDHVVAARRGTHNTGIALAGAAAVAAAVSAGVSGAGIT